MKYQHRDGASATGAVSLSPVRDNARVDAEGVFEVDGEREDFDEVHERLFEAGHEPLDEDQSEEDGNQNGDDADAESDLDEDKDEAAGRAVAASDFTEEELVEMGRQDLRSIAAHYDDDVDGNASEAELTEALIKKRREETEAE